MKCSYRAFLCFIVLSVFAISGCSNENDTAAAKPKPDVKFWVGDTTKVMGIDISHHQGNIDWAKAKKSGLSFVFVKATEGKDYIDSMFTTYWKGLADEHIIKGAYHFYSSDDDPKEQAKWFIGNVNSFDNSLPPVLDIERMGHKNISPDTFEKGVLECLEEIERLSGKRPIIYSSPNFANKYLFDKRFDQYFLWVADYDVAAPTIPNCWEGVGWHFWQRTNIDTMPGIDKDVDQSYFSKDIHTLINLAKQ